MRTRTVSIRFTDTEWELLAERAEREGRTVSNLIRLLAFTVAPTEREAVIDPATRPPNRVSPSQKQAARDQLLNAMRTRNPR